MASKLQEALGAFSGPQVQSLTRVTPMYKPAPLDIRKGPDKMAPLIQGLSRLVDAAPGLWQARKDKLAEGAEDKANEIIRKLTPEQIRQATNDGTLLYQDNPYAMKALKEKVGRLAAFQTDNTVLTGIGEGSFRSREELDKARHETLQKSATDQAYNYGFDANDVDYQRGLNANIVERNTALYGKHDSWLSERGIKGAEIASSDELDTIMSDPGLLRSPQIGSHFAAVVNKGLSEGSIPNDEAASRIINNSLSNVSERVGGPNALAQIGDQKLTIYGKETTYRQFMGDEKWNSLVAKANSAQSQRDAQTTQDFRVRGNKAMLMDDPVAGLAEVTKLEEENNLRQPNEELTPEREQIIAWKTQLQRNVKEQTDKLNKQALDTTKASNRQHNLVNLYGRAAGGEYVSLDINQLPTNESTGNYTKEDVANAGQEIIDTINSTPNLTAEQKEARLMEYLRVDTSEGPFRAHFQTLANQAANVYTAALTNGEWPEDTKALDDFARVYQAYPGEMGAMFPEQSGMVAKVNTFRQYGFNISAIIDAERYRKNRTREQLVDDSREIEQALNDSKLPGLTTLDGPTRNMAEDMFLAMRQAGSLQAATEGMQKLVNDAVYNIKADNVDGGSRGVVPRASLMVTNDARSVDAGAAIINELSQEQNRNNPFAGESQVKYQDTPQFTGFLIGNPVSGYRRVSKDDLKRIHADNMAKAQAKQKAEAEKVIQKAEREAKRETQRRDRNLKKARQTPKNIYGGQNEALKKLMD